MLRGIHPIPKVDDTLAQLAGATLFRKINANSGFWQIPLDEKSRLLTTFITPYGRYFFNKLPFWSFMCTGTFPAMNEQNIGGVKRSGMLNGRCPNIWL